MANELVSVIIPVFNCYSYLAQAIESALAQTYHSIEIIAVNDGSTDGSSDILVSYVPRIKVINQANVGPSVARNNGVAHTNGDYLAFLDGDDLWDSHKVESQLAALKTHPKALAIYCDHRSIDAKGHLLGVTGALAYPRSSGMILEDLVRGQRIKSPSLVMLRRDAFNIAGGFDSHLRYSEDYDLWMRLAARGPILYQLETLASYRVHGNNASLSTESEFKTPKGHLYALKKLVLSDLRIDPRVQQTVYIELLGLGWTLWKIGDTHSSIEAYQCALKIKPISLHGWSRLLAMYFLDFFEGSRGASQYEGRR